jgi:hypothetical protein
MLGAAGGQVNAEAGIAIEGGWPTQACFWLEWGCSDLLNYVFNYVIPTRADHRKAVICGVEGPAVVTPTRL